MGAAQKDESRKNSEAGGGGAGVVRGGEGVKVRVPSYIFLSPSFFFFAL